MKSQPLVRTFDVFYDATHGFAFSEVRAETIYQAAVGLVGRHAGPLALAKVHGLNIGLGDRPMKLTNVRFGKGGYSMLITQRKLVSPHGDRIYVVSNNDYAGTESFPGSGEYVPDTSVAWASKTIISNTENYTDTTLTALAAHEMAHSFVGAAHCPDTACLMQVPSDWEPQNAKLLSQDEPFCDNCGESLEQRKQLALEAIPPVEWPRPD